MLDRLGRGIQYLCFVVTGFLLSEINRAPGIDEVLLVLAPLVIGWVCRYLLSGSASLVPWE